MAYPKLQIDTKKIRQNTYKMVSECKKRKIQVAGVTKLFCGNKYLAKALVDGGVDLLADSRIENLKKLSEMNIPKMLLRIPMLSQVNEVIKYADISLVSELETINQLSKESIIQNKMHNIILMIDLGDLREGIFEEEEVFQVIEQIFMLKGVNLLGIGTNLSCYGGVIPTKGNVLQLVEIKKKIQDKYNIKLDIISGGNSGVISLFKNNEVHTEINQLRLGASLALGIGLNDKPIDGLYTDTFKLIAEIVEIKKKPSVPIGETGLDAFGNKPKFEDKGIRKKAICAIGRQEIDPSNIKPLDKGICILGASSDHLILDTTESEKNYKLGDTIEFNITYGGCLSMMTSEYVYKEYI